MTDPARAVRFTALPGIGEIQPGENLSQIIAQALKAALETLTAGDVLIVAQKIVSKSEGRFVELDSVFPSERAHELAKITLKDPRLIELVLSESTEVMRAKPHVLIVRHRLGYVMANAGIDQSNVADSQGRERALLLPTDPDASAAALREALAHRTGTEAGIIISDSFGRAWRQGVTNIALGSAGVPALIDRRGESDRQGRRLMVTQVAWGDAVAAAAGLVMGEAAEGTPVVLARGLSFNAPSVAAQNLIRPLREDMFP